MVSSSTILGFPLLPILTFSLLVQTAISQDSDLLNKACSNSSANFTSGSPFAKSLKSLLDGLYTNAPINHGFSKASTGGQVHGMALCRGDISPDDCDYCLYDTRCKINNHCNKQTAMVWYDYCQLKYSDKDFFGKIDKGNDLVMINYYNVTRDREVFRKSSIGLLSNLSKQASGTANKYMFAGADINVLVNKKNVTIHGMAQCTRDLSNDNCYKCLDGGVKELPIYNGSIYSVGARVVTASCTVRYETYAFLNNYGSA